jgi:hypothetical protein
VQRPVQNDSGPGIGTALSGVNVAIIQDPYQLDFLSLSLSLSATPPLSYKNCAQNSWKLLRKRKMFCAMFWRIAYSMPGD